MYATIHSIEPFDSSLGTEIKFTWRGNQIYKVRCIVKNNESGTTVYDHTESTMKQSYTIPENSGLVNGVYYVVYITVLDVNNNESNLQDIGTPFYCFSKPIFNLSVSNGEIIKTSAYKVGLNYSQSQGESLDSYSFTLYTYQKTVISSSGDIYNTSDMSYVISGLENAKQYYLRVTGKTLHGITLDTGFILVTVSYTIAQVFNTLELNNKAESGAIELKSNIVSAIGLSEKDVIYIGDEYADLRDNSVAFDEGFQVKGDFTKIFVFYEPERNKSIISFGDGDRLKVDIYYRIGKYADSNGEKAYFELVANSCGVNYVMNSNYVDIPNPSYQQFALLVNRQGSYYDLKVVLISTVIRYSANPDGSNMVDRPTPETVYRGVAYMPAEISNNPNLISSSTTYQNRTVNVWDWQGRRYLFNDLGIKIGDKITVMSTVKLPPTAPKGITINARFFNQNDLYADKPTNVAERGFASIGEEKEIYSVTTVPNLVSSTNLLPPISVEIRYSRNDPDGTGDSFIVQGKCDGIFLGDTVKTWKPSPSDWIANPTNYTWKPL